LDLAEAIDPDCKREIVGIRPGEKLHEEMITSSDAMNTLEFNDYFVVIPSIRQWSKTKYISEGNNKKGKPCDEMFSYNSETNDHLLTIDELRQLIKDNVKP
jgi:FlaA1/EpsC-like NDP-sugar epimerase